jgi:hypothetical protein
MYQVQAAETRRLDRKIANVITKSSTVAVLLTLYRVLMLYHTAYPADDSMRKLLHTRQVVNR